MFLKTAPTDLREHNGLIASGWAMDPPTGFSAIRDGFVVYQDHPYIHGSNEELDTTAPLKNLVMVAFDVILAPSKVLPTDGLQTGQLGSMCWRNQRSGVSIQPRSGLPLVDLVPELEVLWSAHLHRISFDNDQDADEKASVPLLGEEGILKVRSHKSRERDPRLARQKRSQVLHAERKLVCEVWGFDFAVAYADHDMGSLNVITNPTQRGRGDRRPCDTLGGFGSRVRQLPPYAPPQRLAVCWYCGIAFG
jgi:hypothetical protein